MEIYSQSATNITVPMPTGFQGPVVVHIFKDTEELWYGNPISSTSDSITVSFPYRFTKKDSTVQLGIDFTIDFAQERKWVVIDVITPLLTLDEVKRIVKPQNPAGVSDEDAQDLERKVRLSVQAYTGQVFGLYDGTEYVYGTDDNFLTSKRRIVALSGVEFNAINYNAQSYLVKGDGWYVERSLGYPLTIKQAPPDEVLDAFDNYYTSNGAITPPDAVYYNRFNSKVRYQLHGTFGYAYVPEDVKQAARLLVNDYGCNESLYRDRYIANIRAADWRFEFNSKAFLGTGNVQADQLLAPYQRVNMAVI